VSPRASAKSSTGIQLRANGSSDARTRTEGNRHLMRYILILLAAGVAPVSTIGAQSCRGPDAVATRFISGLRLLTSSTKDYDVAQRRDFKIPVVDSTTVTLVTDNKVCQKALATYNTTVPAGLTAATRVYVVKVGTAYVALDSDSTRSKASRYAVLKSNNYALESSYAR
jgi:hypothetical protein